MPRRGWVWHDGGGGRSIAGAQGFHLPPSEKGDTADGSEGDPKLLVQKVLGYNVQSVFQVMAAAQSSWKLEEFYLEESALSRGNRCLGRNSSPSWPSNGGTGGLATLSSPR